MQNGRACHLVFLKVRIKSGLLTSEQYLFFALVSDGRQMKLLLNVGGPNRVSRLQMAESVARIKGYNLSLIKPVSASSVCLFLFL